MQVVLSPDDLAAVVDKITAGVALRLAAERVGREADDRLAYSESEAARLLSMAPHQLRDERRRGKIGASLICGKRIRYTRQDLDAYLASRRYDDGEGA